MLQVLSLKSSVIKSSLKLIQDSMQKEKSSARENKGEEKVFRSMIFF